MRKDHLEAFRQTCQDIYLHREEFHFKYLNEEPIITLACTLHGFEPPKDWFDVYCFYPVVTVHQMNIEKGILSFSLPDCPVSPPDIFLMHWGSDNTRGPLYKREAAVVSQNGNRKSAHFLIQVRDGFQTVLYRLRGFLKALFPLSVKKYLRRILKK